VRIFIGSENKLFSLTGSSLVVSPYMNAERRVIGAVGVIGPTRLNYGRIVPDRRLHRATRRPHARRARLTDGAGTARLGQRTDMAEARKQDAFPEPEGNAARPVRRHGRRGGRRPATDPEAEIAALKQERDEMRDRLMRALADAENMPQACRARPPRGLMYGGAKLARDVLPVYDHLSRALEAAGDDLKANASAVYEGIDLTLRELVNVLARTGSSG
jgi:hypothetical protein